MFEISLSGHHELKCRHESTDLIVNIYLTALNLC